MRKDGGRPAPVPPGPRGATGLSDPAARPPGVVLAGMLDWGRGGPYPSLIEIVERRVPPPNRARIVHDRTTESMCRALDRSLAARLGRLVVVATVGLFATVAAGLVAGPAAASSVLAAQETPPDTLEPRELSDIEVEVTRTERSLREIPRAVSVVDREEVQMGKRTTSMEEGLRGIPGVFVQNRHNFAVAGGARINIRGMGSRFGMRGIHVVVDGVPLTLPDGTVQPTNLDLGSVGRVEVIRGPSSSLYGNAAGGVIRYETEFPASSPVRAEPRVQVGSHGFWKTHLKASGTLDRFQYLATASRMETEGFREYGAAEINRGNLLTRFEISDDTELRGVVNLYDMPFGENASFLNRTDAEENPTSVRDLAIEQGWGESATQGQIGLTLSHGFGGGTELQATGWGAVRDVRNPIPFQVIEVDRVAGGLRSELRGGTRIADMPLRWVTGTDLSVQRDQRQEFENQGVPPGGERTEAGALELDQRERVLGLGPFAELELEFAPSWRLTLGGRYDVYAFDVDDDLLADGDDSGSRTLTEFSPVVALGYSPVDWLELYTNYATAFETPTTTELSNRPSGRGGFNPDLEPVDVRSFEVGAKGRVPGVPLTFDVAGYLARVEGALISFEGANEQTFFRNAGEVSRDGLELAASWSIGPSLRLEAAYTYQDFIYDDFVTPEGDFSGNRQPAVAQHQLYTGLVYSTGGVRGEIDLRWVDDFPLDDANTAFNWSYRVVDLRFSLDRTLDDLRVRPFAGVDNVFDERYNASAIPNAFGGRFYEPAPGTEVYAGVSVPVPAE